MMKTALKRLLRGAPQQTMAAQNVGLEEDESETLTFALRNEALPAVSAAAWVNLEVNVAVSPRKPKPQVRAAHLSLAPCRSCSSFSSASDRTASLPQPTNSLLGSFAAGPSALWRRVERTDGRVYYYSAELGVSQWQRPPAPPLHAIAYPTPDLRGANDYWDELTTSEKLALTVGSLDPVPPEEPPPLQGPAVRRRDRRVAEAPSVLEAVHGDEGADGDHDGDSSTPRLPLLSTAARKQGPMAGALGGNVAGSLLGPPSGERAAALVTAAEAAQAAAAAKDNRVEVARRTREELDALNASLAAKRAEEAAAAEAAKKAEAEEAAAAAAAAKVAKGAKGGKGGGESGGEAAEASKADSGRPRGLTIKQLEEQIDVKLGALREDGEERYRLQRTIQQEKSAAARAAAAAPSYKPFVDLNRAHVAEWRPEVRSQAMSERKRQQLVMQEEASARHAALVSQEMQHALASARGRVGEHWETGHWQVPLPPEIASPRSAGASPRRTPRKGPSTLLAAPGAMFTADSAKGRARRLAARLAHVM